MNSGVNSLFCAMCILKYVVCIVHCAIYSAHVLCLVASFNVQWQCSVCSVLKNGQQYRKSYAAAIFWLYCSLLFLKERKATICEVSWFYLIFPKNIITWLYKKLSKYWMNLVAKFLVPDWVDKVDSSIKLSYQPARLHRDYEFGYSYKGAEPTVTLVMCETVSFK